MVNLDNQDHTLDRLLEESIDRLPLGLGLRAELIQTMRIQRINHIEQTDRLADLLELVSAQAKQIELLQTKIETLAEQLSQINSQVPHRSQSIFEEDSTFKEAHSNSKVTKSPQTRVTYSTQAGNVVRSHQAGDLYTIFDKQSNFEMLFRYCPSGQHHLNGEKNALVDITRGYWMSETVLTVAQFAALMGESPPKVSQAQAPWVAKDNKKIIHVFRRLNEIMNLSCRLQYENLVKKHSFRLPTEAEWEWAALAGTSDPYAGGSILANVGISKESRLRKADLRVATRRPNHYGIFDLSGSLFEWCYDNYDPSAAYTLSHIPSRRQQSRQNWFVGKVRLDFDTPHVLKGGSWRSSQQKCKIFSRVSSHNMKSEMGLRIVINEGIM